MVVLNYTGEEINAKIVYYGPALGGKTTNLEQLYGQMPVDAKGQMVSMKTRTDRTLFFDFFPLELGEISGYRTRFLLYTVPGQVYYNATRKLVLKGADAVVFVADSSPDKTQENIDSLRNLEDNLNENGLSLDNIPWVLQYNKRDVPGAIAVEELHQQLNLMNVPALEAIALNGFGVYDTFRSIAGVLYKKLKEKLESGERFMQTASDEAGTPMPAMKPGGQGDDVTDAVDSALREVEGAAVPPAPTPSSTPPTQPVQIPDPVVPQSAAGGVVPSAVVAGPPPEESEESTDPVESATDADAAEPAWIHPQTEDVKSATKTDDVSSLAQPETGVAPDVGRLVELDESPDVSVTEDHESPEFITDPMQRNEEPADSEPPEFITDPMQPREEPVEIKPTNLATEPAQRSEKPAENEPTKSVTEPAQTNQEPVEHELPKFISDPIEPNEQRAESQSPVFTSDSTVKPDDHAAESSPQEVSPGIESEEGPVITERKTEPEVQEITVPVVISQSQVRKTIPLKLRLDIRVIDD
jgi:signal recognition particle receptor subunit beta